jgi:hypothetical protein
MPRHFEHASADRGKESLRGHHDTMVKGVDGAVSARLTNATHYERLDVLSFDLHVNHRPGTYRLEDFPQRWNSDTAREWELPQFGRRKLRDRATRSLWHALGIDHGIMVYNYDPIACCVHVELYRVRAELEGAHERRNGILWDGVVRPPMRDEFGGWTRGSWAQSWLGMVPSAAMSAKV